MRYLCRQVASQAKQELDGLNVNGVNIQVIHLFIFLILGEPILDYFFDLKRLIGCQVQSYSTDLFTANVCWWKICHLNTETLLSSGRFFHALLSLPIVRSDIVVIKLKTFN